MRNAVITGTSPSEDIWGALTGTWSERDVNGWHIVATPFFMAITGKLNAGSHVLPVKVDRVAAMLLTDGDGNVTAQVVRPGDTVVAVEAECLASLTLFGNVGA